MLGRPLPSAVSYNLGADSTLCVAFDAWSVALGKKTFGMDEPRAD